ncbi:LysR family transcriptional regulator [Rhodospirillum rubrum]|uniref:Transcriptional regulator, LysR family n=2 Tax=Rhodospirillum rubrum TaxID=1085 RepID=Q2RWK5_RHORT|nr:LysR substrate-binding domain-containing protein [Rhodospirillum rubrum]ABC21490.1 transcriptional regulator, LysR family [Rhodospirillum rubrum ATCC 11170]AEO47173.1 LysR family transcriptional regulator [Rhodospirillum rubrum F11]MBK5953086.1 LysR family transcriptional regulator [Rhodospirillum rubrum]QXG81164.1 LysR family transcriptional regulator [Rhodospirillum rubrum]
MRFDLIDLALFVHVVEAGSLTAGAGRAHLALASASARIKGMEDLLGAALLERGRRGVSPTPAGRMVLHHARVVLDQMERLRGDLGGFSRGWRGVVRLAANTAAVTGALADDLGPFLRDQPLIDVDLSERTSARIIAALAEGAVDLGIVSDAVEAGGLQARPYRRDRLVVVMAPDHPLAACAELSFARVLAEDGVGLGEGAALQDYLERQARRLGLSPRLRVRLRGFEAVCRLVAQGIGLAVIPEDAARRAGAAVAQVPLAEPWATRVLLVRARDFATLAPPARRLADHLAPPFP